MRTNDEAIHLLEKENKLATLHVEITNTHNAKQIKLEVSSHKSDLELLPRTSPSIWSGARALFMSVHDPSEYGTK